MAGCCFYCGCRTALELTTDHLTPLSRGGTWSRSNLACACVRCNWAKGTMAETEYREHVKEHGFPWARPELRETYDKQTAQFIKMRMRMRERASAEKAERRAVHAAQRIEQLELLLTYLELMFNAETDESEETIRSCAS